MKKGNSYLWIPLWIDKWLFGSTRIELTPAERSVWIDLLALAAKDDGYIRANENVPYADEQLAGMLCVPLDIYQSTIQKCLKPEIAKLKQLENNTLYVINWSEYQLSQRHKRRFNTKNKPNHTKPYYTKRETKETDIMSSFKDINDKYIDYSNSFWKHYPSRNGKKLTKKDSFNFIRKNVKEEDLPLLLQATNNYARSKGVIEGYAKDAIRFLKQDSWRDWIEPEKSTESIKCVYDNNKPCYFDCKGCAKAIKEVM